MSKTILTLSVALLAAVCCGCSKKTAADTTAPTGEPLMEHALLLDMERFPQYISVDIRNPWSDGESLARYVLVERGVEPDSLPEGYRRLDVPLRRSIVYSAVHTGAIDEMGALDAVAGVADGGYFNSGSVKSGIADGRILDVGSSVSPSLEKIMTLEPDAILLSPFENAGHGALDAMGIPIVECADYMESTPLGRAEWIKFIGALYGKYDMADSIFNVVASRYGEILARCEECESHPLVLTERLTDGYWFVPGGKSYMARFIEDAGGRYPWHGNADAGSLQLDFSAVYARAADADVWLIRTYGGDITLEDLRSDYVLNSQFKAFKNKRVYVANTAEVPLFDEFPFHPELLLAEFAAIFHPESDFGQLKYYRKLDR